MAWPFTCKRNELGALSPGSVGLKPAHPWGVLNSLGASASLNWGFITCTQELHLIA